MFEIFVQIFELEVCLGVKFFLLRIQKKLFENRLGTVDVIIVNDNEN